MTRRSRRALIAIATSVLAIGIAMLTPWGRAGVKAAAVLADAIGMPVPRPFASDVRVTTVRLDGGVPGHLYSPGGAAPGMVMVPGAARRGRDDPRVRRAARAVAGAGRRVLVPELRMYDRTLHADDVDRIADAVRWMAGRSQEPVGVIGFSYGGSFVLLALAREDVARHVSHVGLFAPYYDLANVIQGVTTGATTVGGRTVPFDAAPDARSILGRAAVEVADDDYRPELRRAIERNDPSGLSGDARAVYELLANDDPRRTDELVERLPQPYRSSLERFSPAGEVGALDAPVSIMHSTEDAATPYTESLLLHHELPTSDLITLRHFSHVDPPGFFGTVADGWRAWRFSYAVMRAHE